MNKKIPTKEECIKLLKDNNVPSNVITHCKKVCEVALRVVDVLERKGIKVNRELVQAAALLHDVEKLKKDHILAGAKYIEGLGYKEVADVIIKHGLKYIKNKAFHPVKIEDKIIFYADKRVKSDKIVSLDKRFDYIKKRYKLDLKEGREFTKKLEKELLGEEKICSD